MATKPLSDLTATWNAGGTTFTAIKMNATDTASAAGSLLIDLQVGGVSQFKVSKAGAVTPAGSIFVSQGNFIRFNLTGNNSTTDTDVISQDAPDAFGRAAIAFGTTAGGSGSSSFIKFVTNEYGVARAERARVHPNGGITVGSPTGGNQGSGTINAEAVYDDGVLLTCYVLEHWIDGAIDVSAWDARVSDKEILPSTVNGEEIPAHTEVRQHLPARGFAAVADARLDIDQFQQFLTDNRRLPAFPGPDRWADMFNGKMSTGDVLQRLWETVEVLAVHACKARERELALEARIAALENAGNV
jgi:hypothetical protein